jgi:hypothetical protein
MTSPPDWFKESSWLGFISWASKEESLIAQFEEETGKHVIPSGKTGLEIMIDEACGVPAANIQTMKEFVVWVTEAYWGPDELCPAIYFEKFKGTP